MTLSRQLGDRFPVHRDNLTTIPTDVSVLTHRLHTTQSFLATDSNLAMAARDHHTADDAAATLSIRTLDLFRLPAAQRAQYLARRSTLGGGGPDGTGVTGGTSAYAPPPQQRDNDIASNRPMVNYFNDVAADMDRKLFIVKRAVSDVEEGLRSIEVQASIGYDVAILGGGGAGRLDDKRLFRALRSFNDALKDVSGRIVEVRDNVAELKDGRRGH